MSEHLTNTENIDPTFVMPNPTEIEPGEKVGQVIDYFNSEFGLAIDDTGNLEVEPTAEQLAQLKSWHEATSDNGISMPDIDTFAAKMVLARALMPQCDENGNVLYLFGKGAGVELALQGEVSGRSKQVAEVPYRTHSDFEIYGATTDNYNAIPNSHRFIAVFGGQEIYPVTQTKGLHDLPPDLLHATAEVVNYNGIDFLVPRLELQFVDKFEKMNETTEHNLRGKTDVELLADAYGMDSDLVHSIIDDYVIAPEISKFKEPAEVAELNMIILERKLAQAKRQLSEAMPQASDKELGLAAAKDEYSAFSNYGHKIGVDDMTKIMDGNGLVVAELLKEVEVKRQAAKLAELYAKHEQVDAILGKV